MIYRAKIAGTGQTRAIPGIPRCRTGATAQKWGAGSVFDSRPISTSGRYSRLRGSPGVLNEQKNTACMYPPPSISPPAPYSPVTGGSTPSSHPHQAHQPQGGLWALGRCPSAGSGPGGPPSPAICCAARRGGGAKFLLPTAAREGARGLAALFSSARPHAGRGGACRAEKRPGG